MDFRVGGKTPFGSSISSSADRSKQSEPRSSSSSDAKIAAALTSGTGVQNDDAAVVSSKKSSAPTTPPGVSSFIGKAKDATTAILDLRAQQQELAYEASTLSEGQRTSDLNAEFQDIQTEITRISATATYNGQNVLTGGTFGTEQDDGAGTVVSVSNASAITTNPGVNLLNPDSAATAYEAITDIVTAAAQQSSNAASTLNAAVSGETRSTSETSDKKVASIEEAEALAKKIASEITARFSPEREGLPNVSVLISSIQPDRVAELLK